jgi:hypothetical protein
MCKRVVNHDVLQIPTLIGVVVNHSSSLVIQSLKEVRTNLTFCGTCIGHTGARWRPTQDPGITTTNLGHTLSSGESLP